jgi:hypothetical protein
MLFVGYPSSPVNLLMLAYIASILISNNKATVVQFRPGRQISNLETQVQILAVALN